MAYLAGSRSGLNVLSPWNGSPALSCSTLSKSTRNSASVTYLFVEMNALTAGIEPASAWRPIGVYVCSQGPGSAVTSRPGLEQSPPISTWISFPGTAEKRSETSLLMTPATH